jgi:hypothetical protein
MKKVCKILLLFGAFVAAFSQPFLAAGQSAVSQQAGAVKLPFSLTISYNRTNPLEETTADQTVKGGPSVAFRVRKTNTSDQEIPIRPHGCLLQYDVRDSSGNLVPHKKSRVESGSVRVGRPSEMLQPGESKVIFEDVGSGYEMDKPGTYSVQVSECVSDDSASDVVKSNVLTITVVPVSPPPTQ